MVMVIIQSLQLLVLLLIALMIFAIGDQLNKK